MRVEYTSLDYDYIINAIRKKRKELNYSQEYVAKKVHICPTTYCKIENYNINMSLDKYDKICTFLGLDFSKVIWEASFNKSTYMQRILQNSFAVLTPKDKRILNDIAKILRKNEET